MSDSESYANQTVAQADALLAKVQQDLDDAAEFYRSNNIDPDKVLSALEPFMGEAQKVELAKVIEEDQEAIQREVDEGMARLSFNKPSAGSKPSSGVKKARRSMI